MVLRGYLGATSVERPATSSPSTIELEPATNIEFMGNAAPAASLPEQRDAPAEPPSFPVAAVPASSPNAPAAPARSLGGAIPRADCTASPHCRAQVQRFIVDRTHGFNVGGSSGLKWLTKHMHLLAQAGGKMDAPVVIDVGAGKYGPEGGTDDSDALILLGLLCKPTTNCTVHAFEAIPAKANQLPEEARKRQSTKHLTRFFHAHAAGLGKVTSTLVLYPPGSPKSYNNYKVAVNGFVPPLARPNAINVPIVSLDDFLQREGLLKPSGVFYMKVDIEGGEVGVMEGGSRALAMGAIDYFSFEYAFAWSSAFRNTSLSTGQRSKRFDRNPAMKTHDGAWQHGPVIDRAAYDASGGNSLRSMVRLLSSQGYDSYLINSVDKTDPPVLVPVYDSFFVEPQSELCMYDPYIYQWKGHENPADRRLNCWNDVFVARRGIAKKHLLDVFGTPAGMHLSQCQCL